MILLKNCNLDSIYIDKGKNKRFFGDVKLDDESTLTLDQLIMRILKFGWEVDSNIYVRKYDDQEGYFVVEGNRRMTSIKLINNFALYYDLFLKNGMAETLSSRTIKEIQMKAPLNIEPTIILLENEEEEIEIVRKFHIKDETRKPISTLTRHLIDESDYFDKKSRGHLASKKKFETTIGLFRHYEEIMGKDFVDNNKKYNYYKNNPTSIPKILFSNDIIKNTKLFKIIDLSFFEDQVNRYIKIVINKEEEELFNKIALWLLEEFCKPKKSTLIKNANVKLYQIAGEDEDLKQYIKKLEVLYKQKVSKEQKNGEVPEESKNGEVPGEQKNGEVPEESKNGEVPEEQKNPKASNQHLKKFYPFEIKRKNMCIIKENSYDLYENINIRTSKRNICFYSEFLKIDNHSFVSYGNSIGEYNILVRCEESNYQESFKLKIKDRIDTRNSDYRIHLNPSWRENLNIFCSYDKKIKLALDELDRFNSMGADQFNNFRMSIHLLFLSLLELCFSRYKKITTGDPNSSKKLALPLKINEVVDVMKKELVIDKGTFNGISWLVNGKGGKGHYITSLNGIKHSDVFPSIIEFHDSFEKLYPYIEYCLMLKQK